MNRHRTPLEDMLEDLRDLAQLEEQAPALNFHFPPKQGSIGAILQELATRESENSGLYTSVTVYDSVIPGITYADVAPVRSLSLERLELLHAIEVMKRLPFFADQAAEHYVQLAFPGRLRSANPRASRVLRRIIATEGTKRIRALLAGFALMGIEAQDNPVDLPLFRHKRRVRVLAWDDVKAAIEILPVAPRRLPLGLFATWLRQFVCSQLENFLLADAEDWEPLPGRSEEFLLLGTADATARTHDFNNEKNLKKFDAPIHYTARHGQYDPLDHASLDQDQNDISLSFFAPDRDDCDVVDFLGRFAQPDSGAPSCEWSADSDDSDPATQEIDMPGQLARVIREQRDRSAEAAAEWARSNYENVRGFLSKSLKQLLDAGLELAQIAPTVPAELLLDMAVKRLGISPEAQWKRRERLRSKAPEFSLTPKAPDLGYIAIYRPDGTELRVPPAVISPLLKNSLLEVVDGVLRLRAGPGLCFFLHHDPAVMRRDGRLLVQWPQAVLGIHLEGPSQTRLDRTPPEIPTGDFDLWLCPCCWAENITKRTGCRACAIPRDASPPQWIILPTDTPRYVNPCPTCGPSRGSARGWCPTCFRPSFRAIGDPDNPDIPMRAGLFFRAFCPPKDGTQKAKWRRRPIPEVNHPLLWPRAPWIIKSRGLPISPKILNSIGADILTSRHLFSVNSPRTKTTRIKHWFPIAATYFIQIIPEERPGKMPREIAHEEDCSEELILACLSGHEDLEREYQCRVTGFDRPSRALDREKPRRRAPTPRRRRTRPAARRIERFALPDPPPSPYANYTDCRITGYPSDIKAPRDGSWFPEFWAPAPTPAAGFVRNFTIDI